MWAGVNALVPNKFRSTFYLLSQDLLAQNIDGHTRGMCEIC